MSLLTNEQLDEIRAELESATPGPWSAADEHGDMPGAEPAWTVSRMSEHGDYLYDLAWLPQTGSQQSASDAGFIANAPARIAALLAHIAELEATK